MRNLFLFFLFIVAFPLRSQTIPSDRIVDWSIAGYQGTIPSYNTVVNISDFGGVGDGTTLNDQPFKDALNSLGTASGVIYFPAGDYLFHDGITLRDSIIVRGESADQTTLKFDVANYSNLIEIKGDTFSFKTNLTLDALKEDDQITVSDPAGFSVGDYVILFQNDSSIITSDWAYHSVGQVLLITQIAGNEIHFSNPLRKNYLVSDFPRIKKMIPIKEVGLECFKIEKLSQSVEQITNVNFQFATQCWMKGVESYMVDFAHACISTCSNIEISGCYFHHAFAYGSGGQGYGVALQFTSGECLIENNVFNNLRHSILLQAGVNGNVMGYNYSINTYWDQFPNNLAGDLVLHGNYPFANLFEGNICQNISIDNSHGMNGPYNTFFRNSVRLYGLLMANASYNNDQNFVGNEIVNTTSGNYLIYGTGHFQFGNNFRGTITPAGTTNLPDLSYYKSSKPSFFPSAMNWPSFGTPFPYDQGTIPAMEKFNAGYYTSCTINPATSIRDASAVYDFEIYPNPAQDKLFIKHVGAYPFQVEVYNPQGKLCLIAEVSKGEFIDISSLSPGIYFLKMGEGSIKFIKEGK